MVEEASQPTSYKSIILWDGPGMDLRLSIPLHYQELNLAHPGESNLLRLYIGETPEMPPLMPRIIYEQTDEYNEEGRQIFKMKVPK